jgi:2,3,4,5-tetrahydropyridine-2-carboxylate N-succinyltransferase
MLDQIHDVFASGVREPTAELLALVDAFLSALETGAIRAASCEDGTWAVNPAVKEGILVGFRIGRIVSMSDEGPLAFGDKDTYPIQRPDFIKRGTRIVPGGSSVRRGAYLGKSVTCMPPMYVNVGAYVDDGTMVDSHALVGSCAQIGKNVHLSAAAQIGGVLEPIGMRPVIVEDNVLVGGGTGIYEGTLVRERAVIGAGVTLTRSTPVYDLVRETVYRATPEEPLEIPAGAVVVPGSRPITSNAFAKANGLHVYAPMIIKYRDEKTEASAALEVDLR